MCVNEDGGSATWMARERTIRSRQQQQQMQLLRHVVGRAAERGKNYTSHTECEKTTIKISHAHTLPNHTCQPTIIF